MDLRSDKRQNTPNERDSGSAGRGEAQDTRQREIELHLAFNEDESPADTDRIMEEICEWENLKKAMRRVKANKGSAGIDGVTVDELPDYRDLLVIRDQLLSGAYKPQPVKRVEIPKPDGGVRKLGIPTVLDRFVQQAQQYIAAGYGWVVDLDLEKFFDRVNHDKLMGQIAKRIGESGC